MSRTSQDIDAEGASVAAEGLEAEGEPRSLVAHVFPPRIHALNVATLVVSIVLALVAASVLGQVFAAEAASAEAHDHYIECTQAANDLMTASDLLTADARLYASTADLEFLYGYLTEATETDRRGKAVEVIRNDLAGTEAHQDLRQANELSHKLSEREYYAMRLVAEAKGLSDMPQELQDVKLSEHDESLGAQDKQALACDMLLGSEYRVQKLAITKQVDKCIEALIADADAEEIATRAKLTELMGYLRGIVILLLAIVMLTIIINYTLVIRPMAGIAQRIREDKRLDLSGAYEVRYVARAYNTMYDVHAQHTAMLKHEAETDSLTGLYNRGAYERILARQKKPVALIIIDVDKFKDFNDRYGHDVGDEVLRRVGNTIEHSFRTSDYACRIGGDEFAVIMTDMYADQRDVISSKLSLIADALRQRGDHEPPVTLSMGVAFSTEAKDQEGLFREADEALYMAKHNGRDGFAFYEAA